MQRDFDFICASSPCEEFSVHGMKHFHPNPKYPEMGLKLFNHTRALCEASGVPYVMENVRAAQQFVGQAERHCGSFYLWGNGIPPLIPKGITKGTHDIKACHGSPNPEAVCPWRWNMSGGSKPHKYGPDPKRERNIPRNWQPSPRTSWRSS